ncbi:chondroitin lyase [Aureibaculum marinum]|uniref:Chondroitin lyase n=1 Tax=Aureibaculum marinum TaxID=2487930 RepID=A0A3N4NUA9_9FLAO|nr:polysaccharide lyase family 8 super-sandwich domain-containing protein [Aureibaculum marinum]RPD99961.1 chondroitin lyase [Aureibaculum marinum]
MYSKISFLLFIFIITNISAQKNLEIIEKRIEKELVSTLNTSDMYLYLIDSNREEAIVQEAINTINDEGSWPSINYKDLSLTGYEHKYHIRNLVVSTLLYNKKESKFYKNPILKRTINKGLRYWIEKDFKSANWWHNIVLVPTSFTNIFILMNDDVDSDLFEKAQPIIKRATKTSHWARQSGDRVKICSAEAKNYLLTKDQENFESTLAEIEDQIRLNTGKRGIQNDYSFHHRVHRENNTATYGLGFANVLVEWALFVNKTKYAFSNEKIKLLVDFYLDGIVKQTAFGKSPETGVKNREITRIQEYKLYSSTPLEYLLEVTKYRKDEIKEIIKLRKGKLQKPSLSFSKFFWQSELFVIQRPNYFSSVRMYSIRNRNTELAHNSEGIFNHHRSDGSNHLEVTGDEYFNIWPVYDWQKIPGATILQKKALPNQHQVQKDGLTNFVGATTDGVYGTVGFDFISPHDFIRAKKSWFFFDDEYVCLGAGIASNHFNNTVVTTINQNLLHGDVLVSLKNKTQSLEKGEHKLSDVNWVYHNGIGYVFPEPIMVNLSNKTESGRWSDINLQSTSPKGLVEKDVFKLWIDHGKRPQGENLWFYPGKMDTKEVTYQYIVVPKTTPEKLNEQNNIKILSNNSKIQAVKHTGLNMTQVVFYKAGSVKIDDGITLTLDSPGIIIVKMEGSTLKSISASDPSRNMSKFHLSITGREAIVIDLPQGDNAGKSVTKKY